MLNLILEYLVYCKEGKITQKNSFPFIRKDNGEKVQGEGKIINKGVNF